MNLRTFTGVLLPILLVEILTNSAWLYVSYDEKIRENVSLSYTLSIVAGALSGLAWAWMALSIKQSDVYFANIAWDLIVTGLFFTIPIFLFHIKLDMQSVLGASIALIGLLIMKS